MKDFEEYPRYLTPAQAAEILQISLASFYTKRWRGQIPTIKLGGLLRVDKNRLERFLSSKTTGGDQGD